MATPTPSVYTYETVQKYWAYTSAVYGADGDPSRTPLVVGSATPVAVDQFKPTPDSGFGGALYKDASTGRYTLAFTGSELQDFVPDWIKADGTLAAQDF